MQADPALISTVHPGQRSPPADKNEGEMECVILKWVFDSVVLCGGRVKPRLRDWLSECSSHIDLLGFNHLNLHSAGAIHWKCPRHVYLFIGGRCPAFRSETIIQSNVDVDEALQHCLYYGIYVLELHVGHDPRTHEQLSTKDLPRIVTTWNPKRTAKTLSGGQPMDSSINKKSPITRTCRLCKKPGHNKQTSKRKKTYLLTVWETVT